MKTDTRAPGECSEAEIDTFCELVRAGGEVTGAGLRERVLRAERLVFLRDADRVAGVAGLKNPGARYKAGVFSKAGVDGAGACRFELGWIFVRRDFRGQGLSKVLVESALAGESDGVFATSHTGNVAMHRTLERCGFERRGKPYSSDQPTRGLMLYVRAGSPAGG